MSGKKKIKTKDEWHKAYENIKRRKLEEAESRKINNTKTIEKKSKTTTLN